MKNILKHTPYFLSLLLCVALLCSPLIAAETSCIPNDDRVVYLTFDDGPTPKITEEILDVLKAKKVNATFFIVGKEIKGREAILKRIYEEGHGIGLHTYSHNFKVIYKNPESFIMEMDKTESTINDVLGTQLTIHPIRFPGGSAGRLNKTFYNKLCQKGYLIFDWNVDLQDGIKGNLSPEAFVNNSRKCMDQSTRRIILAHCNSNNKNTCLALNSIIDYYTKAGYTFKAIDNQTVPYFFKYKK